MRTILSSARVRLAGLALLAAGCSSPVQPVAASCPVAAVKLDGVYYFAAGDGAAGDALAPYALVRRSRECVDVITTIEGEPMAPAQDWSSGDASGLRAGSVIYSVAGHDPRNRLIGQGEGDRWIFLNRSGEVF